MSSLESRGRFTLICMAALAVVAIAAKIIGW